MSLEETLYQTPAGPYWKKIGVKNHHGICLPLFSLLSETSCGIGEFPDLLPLIPWCKDLGLDIIQLLPLNDCGLGTSPYSAISAFALNPIHLSLTTLPNFSCVPEYKAKLEKIGYWNRTKRVKYHIVRELKAAFLRAYVPLMFSEISKTPEYHSFVEKQHSWLEPFALFKAIKEDQLWKNWEDWPPHIKSPSKVTYQSLLLEHQEACNFHFLIQFFCYQQLSEVKKAANASGIFLKGDIPILIGKDSADVWHHRNYFFMQLDAGAPPDMYIRDGQHWGFPLYDWEALAQNDYKWWHDRLRLASELYDIYRIDHVVGFFRMWGIEKGKLPKEGTFFPPEKEKWIPHGTELMKMMIKAAPILPVGEDLGLVPDNIKETLYKLGICGTKMMRWEKHWMGDGGFISPKDYQPMTMTTVSTHDSDTLQLWWRHFPNEAKLYCETMKWDYKPFLSPEKHQNILYESHHSASLLHINLLQEYLALFPELVSTNPNDERINVPGKVLDTNWTYRFVKPIEEIVSHTSLKEVIRSILN